MQFAEIFLRLGVALVSWMLIFAHALWLAALSRIGCGPDGAAMHVLLLGIAPLTVLAILMIRATRPMPDIHRILRWFGAPVLLLAPWCLASVWQVAAVSNLESVPICADIAPAAWEFYWAPVQFVLLVFMVFALLVNFRRQADAAGV